MTPPETTVIEIHGVKLEVDLRHARRIENIRVGSRVKLLTKQYDGYKVRHGIVVGFEPFEKLPTIIIAAIELSYSDAKVEFVYFNAKSEGVEVVVSIDDDRLAIDKEHVVKMLDDSITKKQQEIEEIENRKAYFLAKFAAYWEPVVAASEVAAA